MFASRRQPPHADIAPPRGRRATMITTVAAAVTLLALLGGCGGGSTTPATTATATSASTSALAGLSADQVLAKAKAAAAAARSVHIVGQIVQRGNSTTFDLKLTGQPAATGTVTLGGGKVEIVRVGGDIYFKADEQTLASGLGASGAEIAKIVSGRFIKGPLSDPRLAGFSLLTSLKEFTANVLKPSGAITRVDGKPVDGVRTVGLRNNDKARGGTLYVADAGDPFPLLIEALAGDSDTGNLQMSEWNAAVTINPPPPDQVIDLSRLGN